MKAKFFYGWWVVAAGTVLYALGVGSVFYGFNTFFNPMTQEFGWSRAATSGAFSLSRLEGGIEGPIIGPLIDKFGARRIAFIGVLITGIGFLMLLFVTGNVISLYIIFGIFLSIGYNIYSSHATTAAVAKWFVRRRSLAISIITMGGGVGGAIMVPLLAFLITAYGWRTASVITGIGMLIIGLPAAFALRSTPEDKGLLPDGDTPVYTRPANQPGGQVTVASNAEDVSFTTKEALKTRAYWIYVVAMMLRSCILSAIVVHEIPFLTDRGFEYQAAAAVLGIMVLLSVPARLLFGWLGDISSKKFLMFVSCILQAIGIWILINATSLSMVYLFVLIYGIGYGGAIPLQHAIRAELFGRKSFGTITGITTSMTTISAVAAPVFAGYLYDVTQSYVAGFYTFLVMITISGFVFLLIKRPRLPDRLLVTTEVEPAE